MIGAATLAVPRRRAQARSWIGPRIANRLEIAGIGILLIVAAAIRLDGLMVVPRLSDETLEVVLGLRLLREGGLPLVGYAPHIGSLFTYLVALAFMVVGPKIEAGRLVVLTAGVLTVIPTYLLGRDLGQVGGGSQMRGRLIGLIAAFLLVFSGPHIATSSRIAYSNSLTPLFTMLGLWLAHRAITHRSNRDLLLSGAALGLALQTAMSALAVGPGVALAVVLPLLGQVRRAGCSASRVGWPSIPLLLATAAAALLMVGNLVAYSLLFGAGTVSTSGNRIERYVGEDAWTLWAWGDRLLELLRSQALVLGSRTTEIEGDPSLLLSPYVFVGVGLALLGLWVAARRGAWLPLAVTVSVIAIVSLLNGRLEPIVPRLRHYATLLPLGMVMISLGLVWLAEWLSTVRRFSEVGRWLGLAVLLGTPLVLAAGSISAFREYETERLSRVDKHNGPYLAVLQAVAGSGPRSERLYLDENLNDLLTMSGGRMLSHLRYAFSVTGQEFDTVDLDDDALPVGRRGSDSRRLILRAETVPMAQKRYRLTPLPGEPGEGAPLRAFRAFPREP
ncbi:MAG: glycosyltransferase family 39 protein [Chloroflexi bacterium]|nr:glycosyltransferase family 39 protein [Chloroflexota bacterium]